MTCGELLTLLDRYANRVDKDYQDNRLTFLNAGQRYVEDRYLSGEPMYGRWQTMESLATAVGTVPLPLCFRPSAELRVYALPDRQRLTKIPIPYLREPFLENGMEYDLRNTSTLGTPAYFAVLGRTLAIRPLPSAPLDLEIVGTGYADAFMANEDETLISQEAPWALLYAALAEVWKFMGDEPQMLHWLGQADKAIAAWIGDRIHSESEPQLIMQMPG